MDVGSFSLAGLDAAFAIGNGIGARPEMLKRQRVVTTYQMHNIGSQGSY
jgi:hypothetical protein